jgi:oligoribonuclease
MAQDPNALVWIDLEMTGLEPETDRIIEIATIITDSRLNVIEEGPVLAVHQAETVLQAMDEWNTRTHTGTGLVEKVRASTLDEAEAERLTLEFIRRHVPKNGSPLCGNSICQDRRFLYRYMPRLSEWLHYRNLDVSTLKELARRWKPAIVNGFSKKNTHSALDDIRESILELAYYREHLIALGAADSA